MNIDNIFPTSIWWGDLDIDLVEMKNICNDIRDNSEGVKVSNQGPLSYQSPSMLCEDIINGNSYSEFKKLLTIIKDQVNDKFKYSNVWVNINGRGGHNKRHIHPGAVLSGVFYVSVPPGPAGDITFYRDTRDAYIIETFDPHTPTAETYCSVSGRLIIFPSWISHDVGENETDEERISISFNFCL